VVIANNAITTIEYLTFFMIVLPKFEGNGFARVESPTVSKSDHHGILLPRLQRFITRTHDFL
jgi:hypothetical protein